MEMSESTKNGRTTLHGLLHHPVVDFWRREVGDLSSRNFSNRFSASENLVLRLEMYRKLEENEAAVTPVSFNTQGDVLIFGSEDGLVTLWDWERGDMFWFPSGHKSSLFQTKFMPFSNDRTILTCDTDGKVRHVSLHESGKGVTSLLAIRHNSACKIAIEPGSPHIFYTCGDDGLVQQFDLRTKARTKVFTCRPVRKDFTGTWLHTIAINTRNSNLLAVGGPIDEFARLYDIRKIQCHGSNRLSQAADHFCPPHLIGYDQSGVTSLAFSEQGELLVSYSKESIYLFGPDMGLGQNPMPVVSTSKSKSASPTKDHSRCSIPLVYKGHKNFYSGVSVKFFGPRSEYVVSGSECGRIFIWKKKCGKLIRVIGEESVTEGYGHFVTDIEPHPHIPVLASRRLFGDIKVWNPKATERATLPENMS